MVFIFMKLEIFSYLFVITKTLGWSNEKWKLVYLNYSSSIQTPQDIGDHEVYPNQHVIFMWIKFKIFIDVEKIFTLLSFQISLFFCENELNRVEAELGH